MDLESARNLEYPFIISKDADARKHHGELGTSMIVSALRNFSWGRVSGLLAGLQQCQGVPCLLFLSASRWRNGHASTLEDIILPRRGDNPRVLVSSSEEDVTHHGLYDSIWDLCGIKDMSLRRSAAGIQALVVSVAIVVLRRSFCVGGAGRWARCDAATGASLTLRPIFRRRPAATAYAGQCIVQEKFFHT